MRPTSRSLRRSRGYTLMEIIVVMIVLTILTGIVYTFFFSSTFRSEQSALDATLRSVGRQAQLAAHNDGNSDATGYLAQAVATVADDHDRALFNTDTGAVLLEKDGTCRWVLMKANGTGDPDACDIGGVPAGSQLDEDSLAPAAATGLDALSGDGKVTLTWTPPTDPDLDGFTVHVDGQPFQTASGTGGSHEITGLDNGTRYQFAVSMLDADGNESPLSNQVAATPNGTSHPDRPLPPVGVAAANQDQASTVTWEPVTGGQVVSYTIERRGPNASPSDTYLAVASVPTPQTSWRDNGLNNGARYDYRVVSLSSSGANSQPSRVASTTPADTVGPDTPNRARIDNRDAAVLVEWDASAASDLEAYRVYVDGRLAAEVPASDLSHLFTGFSATEPVVNGQRYKIQVAALDDDLNESDPTPTLVGEPAADPGPVPTPTGFTITSTDGTLKLEWDAGPADVVEWQIERNTTAWRTLSASQTSTRDVSVSASATYDYELYAVRADGSRSPVPATVSGSPN